MTMDGGEQVMMVLTLLLVPLTLTDSRKWHWQKQKTPNPLSNSYMIAFITGLCVYITIRIQVAIIYLNAAYAKTKGEHWVDGTAVYYFLQDTLLGIYDGWSTNILPIFDSPLVIIPTWGTIVLEFLLFAALFSQKKHWKWFLTLGLLFHFSIAVFIGLYSFVMVMFAGLILFLSQWQAYLWPLLIVTDPSLQVAPVALAQFIGQFEFNFGPMFAGSTIVSLIPAVILLSLQPYFVQSVSSQGLKE
jgi:antimicrobial peptide system SdpB family protein